MMVVHFPCKLSIKIKKLSVKIKTWDLSVKYKFLISVCFGCLTFCPVISLLYCMIFKLLHYSFVDPDKCIVMIDSCWFTCNFLSINFGTSYSSFEIKHFPPPWCLYIVRYVCFCISVAQWLQSLEQLDFLVVMWCNNLVNWVLIFFLVLIEA